MTKVINKLKSFGAAVFAGSLLVLATGQAQGASSVESMRGSAITADDVAPETKAYGGRPGTHRPVARTFSSQPPVIPHAVDNFDEVTLEENQCLSCHGPDMFKKKNAPLIGKSHFMDREGKKLDSVSALRHNCTQCHVPQVDAPALVDNAFKGDVAKSAGKALAKVKSVSKPQ